MVALLLLLQPGIVLYDRMVMQAAAAEGCRLLATRTDAAGSMDEACEAFIRHRLGSIPQQDCFHVHNAQQGCSWEISFAGDEASERVEVTIKGEVRPLPLLDAGSALLGLVNERGNFEVEASASAPAQPGWAVDAFAGRTPAEWIGTWLE